MRRTLMALAVAALAVPGIASAQGTYTQTQTTTRYDEPAYETGTMEHGAGPSVGIMGNVGVGDYDRAGGAQVNAGVGYGANVDLSPQRNIGLELGYYGGVNNLNSKISTDGRLITNAVGGDLRLNLVPPNRDLPAHLKPFVFGGAFYHRIDTQNFTPGIADNINAFSLPVGAGIEADVGNTFLVGARYEYNFLFNEVDKFGGRNADFWTATVNLGARIH